MLRFKRYVYKVGDGAVWSLPVSRWKLSSLIKAHPNKQYHFKHFKPAPVPPGGATPPVVRMHRVVFGIWHGAVSFGIYNCRPIAGSSTPSQHSYHNAEDISGDEDTVMKPIVAFLYEHRVELRVQNLIHDRRIWNPERGWHDYTGDNPHTRHIHVDFNPSLDGPCR